MKVHKAVMAVNSLFEQKLEKFQIVERNFGILRRVSKKQQEDFHDVIRYCKTVEARSAYLEDKILRVTALDEEKDIEI